MNYRMVIQYDGARYRGWQRQGNQADTVQGRIERALSKRYGYEVEIDGAGRTDAGVHAMAQVANVHLSETIEVGRMRQELNEYLPQDIRILKVEVAGERFHSRLHATGKVYEYHLMKKGSFCVFTRKYCWQMEDVLDVARMREAAEILIGRHDFRGFCTKASKKKSTVRKLDAIDIIESETEIILRFEGDGFLYNMVRILTGTLVETGLHKRSVESVGEILRSGERERAGETAPAQGLFLVRVKYD